MWSLRDFSCHFCFASTQLTNCHFIIKCFLLLKHTVFTRDAHSSWDTVGIPVLKIPRDSPGSKKTGPWTKIAGLPSLAYPCFNPKVRDRLFHSAHAAQLVAIFFQSD